jgi:uncharacterized protein
MATFDRNSIPNNAPGVYIDEVALPGPIPGVSTSIAAFVGPAANGPLGTPIQLTNWTRFSEVFGKKNDKGQYELDYQAYATHAVRGFFDNGGSTCYFVRVAKTVVPGATAALDYKAGIDTLKRIDEVTLLCVPDAADLLDVQQHMILHCEQMQDRFAILDSPAPPEKPPDDLTKAVADQRAELSSDRGYAALYYPWLEVSDPVTNLPRLVPPSGHVAGIYARSDAARGVQKAPANEVVRGVRGVQIALTDDEHKPLNGLGINVLRKFPGRGVVVWGARTTAPVTQTQWSYVNVRRLLLFIEESIQEATQFAVFEPNDLSLWQTVKRQITEFLTRVWRSGGLVGATPDAAFRVRIDEELNPAGQRALGLLVIEIVLYPVTPAEFILFRIVQKPGGPDIQE